MGIRGYTTRGRLCTRFESTPVMPLNDTIPLPESCIKREASHPKSKYLLIYKKLFIIAMEKLRRLIGMVYGYAAVWLINEM